MTKKHHRPSKKVAGSTKAKESPPAVNHLDTGSENKRRKSWIRWIGLSLVFAWALMLRTPIADIPLDRDEGEYAYIAQRALVGEIPYKTSFDQKPPGTFLIYALIERCIGTSPAAIHWATEIYTLGTLAVIFFIGEKMVSGLVGALAAFLFALMAVDTTVTGNSSNTEIFMILPLAASLYTTLVAEERVSVFWGFITGILLGISCLFKQVALVNGVFTVGYLAIRNRNSLPLISGVLGGVGGVLAVVGLYFLAVGAWKEFYECVVGYNLSYSGLVSWADYPTRFWSTFDPQLKTFSLVYVLAALGVATGVRSRSPLRVVSIWFLFSFMGVCIGGYFREHYYIQMLPAIALLAAGQLVIMTRKYLTRYVSIVPIVVVALIAAFAIWKGAWYYKLGDVDEKARVIYGKNPFIESPMVGHYIADHSNPTDEVFIFGSEPQIFYYAGRASASRYIYIYPVMFQEAAGAPDRQRQVMSDLIDHRPKFIVTVFVTGSTGVSQGVYPIIGSLRDYLAQSYEIAAIVPNRTSGPVKLVEDNLARQMWTKDPFWFQGESWCSLAIWRRKG